MKVTVLAATQMRTVPMLEAYSYHANQGDETANADALGEFAGRLCYKSFSRPNPATAENSGYMANILNQGHYSVLEHASVTFLVRGVSRALLAELTRHRHLSFSVVSQRYVDYADTEPVIPPAIAGTDEERVLCVAYSAAKDHYDWLTAQLIRKGLPRKKAREAARAVLPNAAPVDMVVTGNLRAWRDVLGKRHHVAADAEIQRFAHKVLIHLRELAPNSVQDIPNEPYGSEA